MVAAVNLKVNSPALYLLRLLRLVQCADQPRERTRSVDGDGGPAALNIELSRLELEPIFHLQLGSKSARPYKPTTRTFPRSHLVPTATLLFLKLFNWLTSFMRALGT